MIIKKKKNDNNNNDDETSKSQKLNNIDSSEELSQDEDSLFSAFQNITERQERRRGDRRRGYRRVDDRNLISRAQEEANIIRENAVKEGFQIGIEKAGEKIENLKLAISDLISAKDKAYSYYMNDISFIALKVAEKIIQTEVACDETIVLKIISEVLKDFGKDENRIIIKTSPSDLLFVNENMPELFSYSDTKVKIYVEEDNSVDSGSCIIQTTSGQIDARFSTQLEILKKTFENELQEK
ncbi:MAG: FliH/SctL family protein [Candidatus Gastranaerophilaceae bacterium]|jgi:flagellar assembly protein FliH